MKLKKMINVIQHFADGGEVECSTKGQDSWETFPSYRWNWENFDYRIKETKQKVTIEKWLFRDKQGDFLVIEISNADNYKQYEKVKLIKSYEVEL